MHFLALENIPDSGLGGQERSLFEICEGLFGLGHEVSLAYRQWGNLLPEYDGFVSDKIHVRKYILTRRDLAAIGLDLARLVGSGRRHRWRLAYASQYFDAAFSVVLGKLLGIPVVCHLRLPAPSYLSRQYRWGLNRCKRLIAISQATKAGYVRAGIPEERISVIYNAIDTSVFVPANALSKKSYRDVVFLGRIAPEKGVRTLIKAFRWVSAEREDVRLSIYGDERACDGTAGFFGEMQRLAGEQLDRQIYFHPPVSDVTPILQRADLVVVPSEWEEPFGRVLIEAMACGVPVLGTRVGGIPEILAPSFEQLLVGPREVGELTQKIKQFVDWKIRFPGLGRACRDYTVERFDRKRLLGEMEEIFMACAMKKGSGKRAI